MPNIKQAIKKVRQDKRKNVINRMNVTKMRGTLKNTLTLIDAGKGEEAQKSMRGLQSALDRAVSKGVIHANKARRHKKRLISKIKELTK